MTKDEIKSKIKIPYVRKRLFSDDHLARYEISFYVSVDDADMFDKLLKEITDER